MKHLDQQRLGQLFIVGQPSTELTNDETQLMEKIKPAGFIHFRRNLIDPMQIQHVNRQLSELSSLFPAFIAIDQEGGRVQRLPQLFYPYYPKMSDVGLKDNVAFTYELAQHMGFDLKQLGFNLNFAPVLDVLTQAENPIIVTRSFSNDPHRVAKHAISFMKGLQASQMIPCGKHFPGHGDTTEDSHLTLPVLNISLDEMKKRELIPFQKAVAEGLDVLMTAHIVFKELDTLPATLSDKVLPLLLKHVNFKGIVFSDDFEMKAISANYPLSESISLALKAGVTTFIISRMFLPVDYLLEAYEVTQRLYQDSPTIRPLIDKAIDTVVNFKGHHKNCFTTPETLTSNQVATSSKAFLQQHGF